jgi:hypothetical protein
VVVWLAFVVAWFSLIFEAPSSRGHIPFGRAARLDSLSRTWLLPSLFCLARLWLDCKMHPASGQYLPIHPAFRKFNLRINCCLIYPVVPF